MEKAVTWTKDYETKARGKRCFSARSASGATHARNNQVFLLRLCGTKQRAMVDREARVYYVGFQQTKITREFRVTITSLPNCA